MRDRIDRLIAALEGRYTIERELGSGGMATVYLAEDAKHHRKVAIKVLRSELAALLGAERFLQEIQITANLQHPHILHLYDSGEEDGILYYVMPYVAGSSLRERLDHDRQLAVEETLKITEAVAAALDHAHRLGIIHRDIKPENILLQDGLALLADFGISLAVKAAGERVTETGLSLGTPSYMSPEQVAGQRNLDGRSDVYSLACVTYEMLAGDPPFVASNPQAVMAKHVTDEAPPITTMRPSVGANVAQALAKALSKTPVDRYESAGAFVRGLRREVDEQAEASKTIVVLPFANLSPDPANEYFSDGLTEEIIADLSPIQALSVISRSSAMRLKGTSKDVKTVGRELGVRYVLEGSVRKAGNNLRITAELIDAVTDTQLWADKFGGTMDDVFDLQESVSRKIVSALNVTLTSEEDKRLADRPIADARAYELYLQTRLALRKYGSVPEQAAKLVAEISEHQEASPVRALMDWAKANQVRAGLNRATLAPEDAQAQARAILEMAPDAPYGYALLGHIAYDRWDMSEAIRYFKLALERDPNDVDTLWELGLAYNSAGQIARANEIKDRLIARDPLSPLTWMIAGATAWFEGDLQSSPALFERGLELDPENIIMRWCTGYAYCFLNDVLNATPHAAFMREHAPDLPYTAQLNALVESLHGNHSRALEWLAHVDATTLDPHQTFHLAESYASAGETDTGLDLLDDAVNGGFYPYPYIAEYCPFFNALRGGSRFSEIAETARQRAADLSSVAA